MTKKIFSLLIFPVVVSVTNQSSANVETSVRNEVSGQSASVNTQIINKVNDVINEVTSTQPGEIKVSVKNGKIETEINVAKTPLTTIVPQPQIQKEIQQFREQFRQILNNFLKRIFGLFKLGA